jgi:signal peptidase I
VNGEVIVPPGKYFVLGDNRDNSLDRRYWGFVDESEVIGEPFLIYDSEAGSTSEVGPSLGKETHTRWDRVLKRL